MAVDRNDEAAIRHMGEAIIESMADQDSAGLRLPRMTGAEKAAAKKREQSKVHNQMVQGHKLTSSSVGGIGFVVLFPTSILVILVILVPPNSRNSILVISFFFRVVILERRPRSGLTSTPTPGSFLLTVYVFCDLHLALYYLSSSFRAVTTAWFALLSILVGPPPPGSDLSPMAVSPR